MRLLEVVLLVVRLGELQRLREDDRVLVGAGGGVGRRRHRPLRGPADERATRAVGAADAATGLELVGDATRPHPVDHPALPALVPELESREGAVGEVLLVGLRIADPENADLAR